MVDGAAGDAHGEGAAGDGSGCGSVRGWSLACVGRGPLAIPCKGPGGRRCWPVGPPVLLMPLVMPMLRVPEVMCWVLGSLVMPMVSVPQVTQRCNLLAIGINNPITCTNPTISRTRSRLCQDWRGPA